MRAFDVLKELAEMDALVSRVCQCQFAFDNEKREEVKAAKKVILEAEKWEFISRIGKLWLNVCGGVDYS